MHLSLLLCIIKQPSIVAAASQIKYWKQYALYIIFWSNTRLHKLISWDFHSKTHKMVIQTNLSTDQCALIFQWCHSKWNWTSSGQQSLHLQWLIWDTKLPLLCGSKVSVPQVGIPSMDNGRALQTEKTVMCNIIHNISFCTCIFLKSLLWFFGHSVPDSLKLKEKGFCGIPSPRWTTSEFTFVSCLYLLLICGVTFVQTLR